MRVSPLGEVNFIKIIFFPSQSLLFRYCLKKLLGGLSVRRDLILRITSSSSLGIIMATCKQCMCERWDDAISFKLH